MSNDDDDFSGITQESFDLLLHWLNPDRDEAGQKYEKIRLRLIKLFACRGRPDAEDLADKAISRVTKKVKQVVVDYEGDPALYFYGVARKVYLEILRPKAIVQEEEFSSPVINPQELEAAEELEQEYSCLELCMEKLPKHNRHLVLEYYQEEKGAKIDHRKRLSQELGIALNALRIRAHRIRVQLQKCMEQCVEKAPVH